MPKRNWTYVDDPVALGARLREARRQAGVSQRELAFPGCTAVYICRIESGQRTPSLQVLRELAKRLGVSEEFLLTGEATGPAADDSLVEAEVALRLDHVELAEHLFTQFLDEGTGEERGRGGGRRARRDDGAGGGAKAHARRARAISNRQSSGSRKQGRCWAKRSPTTPTSRTLSGARTRCKASSSLRSPSSSER